MTFCSLASKRLVYKILSLYIHWHPYNGSSYFVFPPCQFEQFLVKTNSFRRKKKLIVINWKTQGKHLDLSWEKVRSKSKRRRYKGNTFLSSYEKRHSNIIHLNCVDTNDTMRAQINNISSKSNFIPLSTKCFKIQHQKMLIRTIFRFPWEFDLAAFYCIFQKSGQPNFKLYSNFLYSSKSKLACRLVSQNNTCPLCVLTMTMQFTESRK